MPFHPPDASSRQLAGVPFDSAVDFAAAAKARYDAFDRRPSNSDPSKCKALLAFPVNGSGSDIRAVFWSAKMSIDADGPSAGPRQKRGKDLDPTGQNVTTFRFSGGGSLPAEAVPYIVLPLNEDKDGPFDPTLSIGDVAIVIFKDMITAAICGDLGPVKKIGEASIRVHEALQPACPDPCRRDGNGFCSRVRNASVEEDVLYFAFPNSAFANGELTLDNVTTKVKERAFTLYNQLRGAS
jgi:Fungal chitosanase of glycosyl hydrolase group 75